MFYSKDTLAFRIRTSSEEATSNAGRTLLSTCFFRYSCGSSCRLEFSARYRLCLQKLAWIPANRDIVHTYVAQVRARSTRSRPQVRHTTADMTPVYQETLGPRLSNLTSHRRARIGGIGVCDDGSFDATVL